MLLNALTMFSYLDWIPYDRPTNVNNNIVSRFFSKWSHSSSSIPIGQKARLFLTWWYFSHNAFSSSIDFLCCNNISTKWINFSFLLIYTTHFSKVLFALTEECICFSEGVHHHPNAKIIFRNEKKNLFWGAALPCIT